MKIPALKIPKFRLPELDWQKYSRLAVGVLTLLAFIYVALLIRTSQTVTPDKVYLEKKRQEFNPATIKVTQKQLDSITARSASRPPGRNPFKR